ncbi:hypothetical protein QJS10_CPA08g01463 [Acorus calamus]|uniref:Uncharacterized protein n=1 Tax=Acorus calamus TaxID=4465 RepID=A0AAV9ED17_ACOCL|nr:hypothetical protein QJS10_CPA08g01463 [Acorus calamus]
MAPSSISITLQILRCSTSLTIISRRIHFSIGSDNRGTLQHGENDTTSSHCYSNTRSLTGRERSQIWDWVSSGAGDLERKRRGGALVVRAEMFGQLTSGLESAWNKLKGVEVIGTISHQFSLGDVYKTTLYRFLYMSNTGETATSLKRFLYDIHLSNTGMHILPIFCRVVQALYVSMALLLTLLDSREYKRQVDAMMTVLRYMQDKTGTHSKQMWKYGL